MTPPGGGRGGRDKPVFHALMPPWGGVGVHETFGYRMPPLPSLTLAALVRRCGWTARVVDRNFDPFPDEEPDLVGITVWTALAPDAYHLAEHYRRRGIPVVLGGVHASLLPNEALRHADAVVVGEAESVMPTVLSDALAGRLRGVYEGRWGQMSEVPMAGEWIDLVERKPYYRYIPRNVIQTTRGCRFNCDYCSVIRINGRGSRHRDPEAVVEELRMYQRRGQRFGPFCYVSFQDDDLAADLAYTEELARAIVRSGVRVGWSSQASIGITNDGALLDLLARAGCKAIFSGLESVSREALVECNKKNRPHKYREAVRRLHERGIIFEAGFIFGFDHDDERVFEETVELADQIELDGVHLAILTPLPGTHTFARMAAEDRITTYDWSRYDLYHAVIEPARMSPAALEAGLRRAYRQFYARRPRLRRWWRHVRTGFSPAMGTAITLNNANYARHFGNITSSRPSYVADAGDIERLKTTSSAPAERAVSTALSQVPVTLGRRPREPSSS
jgi:radical SAM superfamily enzyme YgiQ (UPF0313 family)